jgi:hypothetical protein
VHLPRRIALIILGAAVALSTSILVLSPAALASTGGRTAARLVLGPSLQERMLRLYAADRHIPVTDIGRVAPALVQGARDPESGTDWAVIHFVPSPRASHAVEIRFQDGAATAIFTSSPGKAWTLAGLGGEPVGCGEHIPVAVRQLWGLASCADLGGSGAPGTSGALSTSGALNTSDGLTASGTTGDLAKIAVDQVGVSVNPPSTNWGLDCDPYTTLVGNTWVSTSGCGKTSNGSYFSNVQDRNEFWCADFTKWVWEQAGVTSGLSTLTAAAASFYTWGQNHGESMPLDPKNPKVGDAVVYYPPGKSPNGNYADHVGIVTAVNTDGTVNLVNGDIMGSNTISVEYATHVTVQWWANNFESQGEGWTFVSSKLPQSAASPGAGQPSGPAVYDKASGNLEVYGTGTDASLQEDYWDPGSGWSGWKSLGGSISGDPAAIYDPASGNLEVYATGTDGSLQESYWDSQKGWRTQDLGGSIAGSPSPVFNEGSGNLEVYARGTDGTLQEIFWDPESGWSSWKSLGGSIAGTPSAVYDPLSGDLEVYARGTDGTLDEFYWDSSNGWRSQSLGGSIAGSPSAVYDPAGGDLEVYARGTDGTLDEFYWDAAKGWRSQSLGGSLSGGPSAVHDTASGNLEVYARGSDGTLQEIYWNSGSGWSSWKSLGTAVTGSPYALDDPASGDLEVYALGTDGTLQENYWDATNGWRSNALGGSLSSL